MRLQEMPKTKLETEELPYLARKKERISFQECHAYSLFEKGVHKRCFIINNPFIIFLRQCCHHTLEVPSINTMRKATIMWNNLDDDHKIMYLTLAKTKMRVVEKLNLKCPHCCKDGTDHENPNVTVNCERVPCIAECLRRHNIKSRDMKYIPIQEEKKEQVYEWLPPIKKYR